MQRIPRAHKYRRKIRPTYKFERFIYYIAALDVLIGIRTPVEKGKGRKQPKKKKKSKSRDFFIDLESV